MNLRTHLKNNTKHMAKKLIILNLIIFQLLLANSFAQTWYLTKGLSTDEVAWGVDVDSVGNIYWAIEEKDQWPYWYQNILLFKIDSNAKQIWQSTSWGNGTGFNDIGFIVKVQGQNVYVGGRSDSTLDISGTGDDALVMSYDLSNGNLNWANNITPYPDYGYQEIDGLLIQSDGIYITGWTAGQTTDMDFLIQKIDLNGNPVWINSWDYNNLGKFDGGNGHMAMDSKYIYAAGHVNRTNIISFDGDGALVCFDRNNGAEEWNVTWGGWLYDDALGMTMSADSMLYMVGYTASYGNGSQVYLNKYSRTGQLKWSQLWGGSGAEVSRAIVTDGDSLIFVVGATLSYGNGGTDILVLKYDTAGTLLDSLIWGGAYDEVAHDVVMYGDYLYITGETKSYGNGLINGDYKADGLLLKINGRTMESPDSITTAILPSIQVSDEIKFIADYQNAYSTFHFNKYQNETFSIKAFNSIGQEKIIHPEIFYNGNSVSVRINFSELSTGIYFLQLNKNENFRTEKIIIMK